MKPTAPHTLASLSRDEKRTLKSLLAAVVCMQIITPLLQSSTMVILPAIGESFQCSATELGLVSTIYCMALSIFNLAMGRAGDKWGRRRVCLFSMVVLAPTSILIALAPNIESVIAMRFCQGMGTAAFSTSSLAMLMALTPPDIKGRVLGTTSTAAFVSLAGGPLLSGWINTLFGWEYFFCLIAVWAAVCFGIMLFSVRREWHEDSDKPYDWAGLGLFAASMVSMVLGLIGPVAPSIRPFLIGAGTIFGVLFATCEYRMKATIPLLDLKVLIHNKIFVLSTLASFALYASLFSLTFFLSLYLQYAMGLNSAAAGTFIFIQPFAQMLLAWPGGWLSDRFGAAPVALAGNILAAVSLCVATTLSADSSLAMVALILILNGLGNAFFVAPNTVMIMSSVDPAHLSQASGLVGSVRTGGMVVSMVTATLTLRLFMHDVPLSAETCPALLEAMHASFVVFAVISLISFVCSALRYRDIARAGR